MLKAFQYGKIKSETKEDSLTASVFQLLNYLPNALLVKILRNSIYGGGFPEETGGLLSLTFWDKWKMPKKDKDGIYVEPDVFLSFEELDLIVEAKRWDHKQQSEKQWKRELSGYFNDIAVKEEEQIKPVYLLALGGLHNETAKPITLNGKKVLVLKARWSKLLTAILNQKKSLEGIDNPSPLQISQLRIFKDLITSFELHGFFAGTWFKDEKRLKALRPNKIITDQLFLNNIKLWQPIK